MSSPIQQIDLLQPLNFNYHEIMNNSNNIYVNNEDSRLYGDHDESIDDLVVPASNNSQSAAIAGSHPDSTHSYPSAFIYPQLTMAQQYHQQQYFQSHTRNPSYDTSYPQTLQPSHLPYRSYHNYNHTHNASVSSIVSLSNEPPIYPGMDFDLGFNGMQESVSNNTLSSFESIPQLSNSLSNQSLHDSPSSVASQGVALSSLDTPRRARNKSISTSSAYVTPLRSTTSPKVGKTPRRGRGHARTRSRLSVDASNSLSILTGHIKSPSVSLGTNPFYTPPTFLSPKAESPEQPSLAAPLPLTREEMRSSYSTGRDTSKDSIPMEEDDALQQLMKKQHNHQDADKTLTGANDTSLSSISDLTSDQQNSLYYNAADMSLKYSQAAAIHNQGSSSFEHPELLSSSFNDMDMHSFQGGPYLDHYQTSTNIPSNLSFITPSQAQIGGSNSITKSHSSVDLASIASSSTSSVLLRSTSQTQLDTVQSAQPESAASTPIKVTDRTKNAEKKKKNHECQLCHARFQRPEHVKRHMKSHSSEKPYHCDEPNCDKRFNRNDNLKAHLRKIHKRQI